MSDQNGSQKNHVQWEQHSRNSSFKHAILYLYKALYVLINTVIFGFAWCVMQVGYKFFASTSLVMMLLMACFLFFMVKIYGGFPVGRIQTIDLVFSQSLALLLSNAAIFIVEALVLKKMPDIMVSVVAYSLQIVFSILWSYTANNLHHHLFPPIRTAVIYEYQEIWDSLDGLYQQKKYFNIVKTLNSSGPIENLIQHLHDVDAVFLCAMPSSKRNDILKYCIENGIYAYVRPKIGDVLLTNAQQIQMFYTPVLLCSRKNPPLFYSIAKRFFDIIISSVSIIFFSPLMVIIACSIKAYDHGPSIYKQKRLTRNGQAFYIYKFRSMHVNAEKDGVARLASKADDRITPVGKVLRKVRFDELPQLFNILKGDMSFVGPRPERPEIAELYLTDLPEFNLRLQVKAGLTGYAQINGKYNSNPYDKLQMDLLYIANQSFLEDIKILFQTLKILFKKESTEGISEDAVTAKQKGHKIK